MTNVLIIEDNSSLLDSFTEIVNMQENYSVIGAFTSYEAIPLDFKLTETSILITDIQLPGINGIEGVKKLKLKHPSLIVIVITVHEDSEFVFDALCAGAIGYLVKNSGALNLINVLEQAKNGGAPMSAKIARKVVESFNAPAVDEKLTSRENDVLRLLSKGKSYPSIAKELYISLNTVKGHVKHIYEKLQVNSKEEIINKYNKGI